MGGDTIPSPSSASAPARDEFPAPSSSASLSSGPSAPPTAADLARIAQQEAMMERLMERKLALLEAEYNECINAENRARDAAAQHNNTSADIAARQGYVRAGQAALDGEEEEEEFSPAWTQFKRDMEEERLRQQAAGIESDSEQHPAAAAEEEEESKRGEERLMHAPLTSDKILSIKSVMSGIKLRPPPWAIGMSEEVWMARILERAGFVRRAMAAKQNQSTSATAQLQQQPLTEEEKRKRREKKKARKAKTAAKKAAVANAAPQQSQQQQKEASGSEPIAAAPYVEDFEATFPAMPSPRSAPSTAVNEPVTQTA